LNFFYKKEEKNAYLCLTGYFFAKAKSPATARRLRWSSFAGRHVRAKKRFLLLICGFCSCICVCKACAQVDLVRRTPLASCTRERRSLLRDVSVWGLVWFVSRAIFSPKKRKALRWAALAPGYAMFAPKVASFFVWGVWGFVWFWWIVRSDVWQKDSKTQCLFWNIVPFWHCGLYCFKS